MKKNRLLLVAFVLNAIVHLAAGALNFEMVGVITKPLIVLLLIAYYLSSSSFRSRPLLIALIACWLGDVFLMFVSHGEIWFMSGLASFLIGHSFYIIAYRQHRWESRDGEMMPVQKIRFSMPVVLAGTGLITVLYPALGGLKLPVMVYALVITVMVMNAIFRFGRTPLASFWMVLGGAVLFMISDSILAINKFLGQLPAAGFWIMTTYIAAQYLIVGGLLNHESSEKEA